MPELPEVETIRGGLEKYVVGKTVKSVEVRLQKIIGEGNVGDLGGKVVEEVRRFGKVLVLDFTGDLSLLVHIKLTGQIVLKKGDGPPLKWTHVIFNFTDGSRLFYNDIRQFGWMRVLPTKEVEKFKFIRELGPEPIRLPFGLAQGRSGQAPLTLDRFREILQKRNTKIKPLLLDQKLIGGVGNIYSNDALFLAGIDPQRPAKSLSLSEQSKLYEALLEVLRRGLKYGGASEYTYLNVLGEPGEYQKHFLVYGRAGLQCHNRCGNKIVKIHLGGRGTFYCSRCQV